ncbi:uncharacterized protein G2W53_004248 [Senna tora]|uniref:Uncharacterized protein n=1 Tax=Senna tora TaxID=362788 RepID=A0A835CJ62_9FABA|nr:uncharacterized protein G2W53_004248 [Senna tora]
MRVRHACGYWTTGNNKEPKKMIRLMMKQKLYLKVLVRGQGYLIRLMIKQLTVDSDESIDEINPTKASD